MGVSPPGGIVLLLMLLFSSRVSSQLYATSCAELKESGLTSDGVYTIDPDGSNGISPFNVSCDMDRGATILQHTGGDRIFVNGFESPYSYEWLVDYGGLSISQVAAVVDASDHCAQYIKYECIYSMIRNFVAWYDRRGSKVNSWGGAPKDSEKCMCGVTGTCQDEKTVCNCNLNDRVWREDSGNITDKADLPVTAVRAGDTGSLAEKAYITLGPLVCWGASQAPIISGKPVAMVKSIIPGPRVTKRSVTAEDVTVECSSTTMTVYIRKNLLNQRFEPNNLNFLDESCFGFNHDPDRIALSSRYDTCGFTSEATADDIIYSNTISCTVIHPEDAVITRRICDVHIDVRCQLPRRQVLSRWYNLTIAPLEIEEVGYGTFIVEFERYTNNNFNQLHDNAAAVPLQRRLFYALKLTSNSDITLFVDHCWSTPSADPLDDTQYDLIKDGCDTDDTLQRYNNFGSRFKPFSFKAYKFIGDYLQVYIHCEVITCIAGDSSSRCSQGCVRRGKRALGTLHGSNSQPRIISQILGPFLKDDDVKGWENMKAGQESNYSIMTALGAATLCIFIGMAAMYAGMKARRKKSYGEPY